jgi:hypothetical protein
LSLVILLIILYLFLVIYSSKFKTKILDELKTTKYLGISFKQKAIVSIIYFLIIGYGIYSFFPSDLGNQIFATGASLIICIFLLNLIFQDLKTMAPITNKELVLVVRRKIIYRIPLEKFHYFRFNRKFIFITYTFYDRDMKEIYVTDEGFYNMDLLINITRCKKLSQRR